MSIRGQEHDVRRWLSCVITFFYQFEYNDFIGMVYSTIQGHLEVNTKMAAVGLLELLTFRKNRC